MNIWDWIIGALLIPLTKMADGLPHLAEMVNFATPIKEGFLVFLKLSYLFFSVFNLWWFGLWLSITLFFALLKIGLAVGEFLVKIVKIFVWFFTEV